MALPTQKYLNISTGGLNENVPTKEVTDSLFSGLGLNVTDDFNDYLIAQGLTGTSITNLLKYICQYDQNDGYKFSNRLCHVTLHSNEYYYVIQSYNINFHTLFISILELNGPVSPLLPGIQVHYYASSQGSSATEIMSINASGITKPSAVNKGLYINGKPYSLPQVTTSDVGKFLRVNSSGQWIAQTVSNAEGGAF